MACRRAATPTFAVSCEAAPSSVAAAGLACADARAAETPSTPTGRRNESNFWVRLRKVIGLPLFAVLVELHLTLLKPNAGWQSPWRCIGILRTHSLEWRARQDSN